MVVKGDTFYDHVVFFHMYVLIHSSEEEADRAHDSPQVSLNGPGAKLDPRDLYFKVSNKNHRKAIGFKIQPQEFNSRM